METWYLRLLETVLAITSSRAINECHTTSSSYRYSIEYQRVLHLLKLEHSLLITQRKLELTLVYSSSNYDFKSLLQIE